MSERHVKDKTLKLKQLNDPDDCEGTMHVTVDQGIDWVIVELSSYTSDTREYGSGILFLEPSQIKQLHKFLGDHLECLNLPD